MKIRPNTSCWEQSSRSRNTPMCCKILKSTISALSCVIHSLPFVAIGNTTTSGTQ
nr:MAG TPA: hypothetical protein [Caudoviricetes sp.]